MTRKVQLKQNFTLNISEAAVLRKNIFAHLSKLGFGLSCQVEVLLQHCFPSGWVEKHQDGKNQAKRFILIIKTLELSTEKPQSIATLLLPHCMSANKIPCFMCPRGNMDECLLLRTL